MMTQGAGEKPAKQPEGEEIIHELQPWAEMEFREWLAARHRPEPEGAD